MYAKHPIRKTLIILKSNLIFFKPNVISYVISNVILILIVFCEINIYIDFLNSDINRVTGAFCFPAKAALCVFI